MGHSCTWLPDAHRAVPVSFLYQCRFASFPFTLYFHLLNIPFKMIFKVIVAAFANPMLRNWLVICHRRTTCILSKVVVAKITLSKVFKAKQLIEFSILKTFIFQVFFLSHNSPIISPCPLPCFWVWQPVLAYFHFVLSPFLEVLSPLILYTTSFLALRTTSLLVKFRNNRPVRINSPSIYTTAFVIVIPRVV